MTLLYIFCNRILIIYYIVPDEYVKCYMYLRWNSVFNLDYWRCVVMSYRAFVLFIIVNELCRQVFNNCKMMLLTLLCARNHLVVYCSLLRKNAESLSDDNVGFCMCYNLMNNIKKEVLVYY